MQAVKDLWNKGWVGKLGILGAVSVTLCLGCVVLASLLPTTDSPPPTVDVGALQTSIVETTVADLTLKAPTATPGPTATPKPTQTPIPSATSTPLPEPIILTGTGDSIVDFQKWEGPAILRAKYSGGGNFVIRNYPAGSSTYYDLLVNVIGTYEGTLPLDLLDVEQTARFEIMASGPWELQILPLYLTRVEQTPGIIQGRGDDVIILVSKDNLDLLKVDASQASSNFVVFSYSDSGRDLVVNEIAPYTGTSILNSTTILLVVKATGPWSLEITTR